LLQNEPDKMKEDLVVQGATVTLQYDNI